MKKIAFVLIISALLFTSCSCEPVPNAKLQLTVGEPVELVGALSDQPWQHMIDIREDYPYIAYIDFEDGDQLVVYTKVLLVCPGEVSLKGTVIEIEGQSKRPGSEEKFVEVQITADEVLCDGKPIGEGAVEEIPELELIPELE
ncbi:hypothetical protein ACFLZH_00460 [Patescibacteria group bacterium]